MIMARRTHPRIKSAHVPVSVSEREIGLGGRERIIRLTEHCLIMVLL